MTPPTPRWPRRAALAAAGAVSLVAGAAAAPPASAEDSDTYTVNGHQLSETTSANIDVLAAQYDRLQGDHEQRVRTLAVGTWWSLKEGPLTLGMTEADGFNNCHEMPADVDVRHDGEPLYSCTGDIWQVGVVASQVQPVRDAATPVEETYLGLSEHDALAESLALNGVDPESDTGQAVLNTDDEWLQDSWLARHPVVGLETVAPAAEYECFGGGTSDPTIDWCFSVQHEDTWDTEEMFAYDSATAQASIADLTAIYEGLVAEGGSEPGPEPAPVPFEATVADTGGVGLHVRAEPTSSSASSGVVDTGDPVAISCQVEGDHVVNDVAGWESSLWNRVDGGYVADAWIDTGHEGRIPGVPDCADAGDPAPEEPTPDDPVEGQDGCVVDHALPEGASTEELVAGIRDNWGFALSDGDAAWSTPGGDGLAAEIWATLDRIDCTPFYASVTDGAGGTFTLQAMDMGGYYLGEQQGPAQVDLNVPLLAQGDPATMRWLLVHELSHAYFFSGQHEDQVARHLDLYNADDYVLTPYVTDYDHDLETSASENFAEMTSYYVARCHTNAWGRPYEDSANAGYYELAHEIFGGVEFNPAGPGEPTTC